MDKLKSIFNPGAKADDDVLYGDGNSNNLGKVAGEGSHFGHSRTTDPSGATTDPATTSAPNPAIDASKAATSSASAQQQTPASTTTQTPSTEATKAAQIASKPQTQDIQSQAPATTQDPQTSTAGLAASRADAKHHESALPDRSVGSAGKPSVESQKDLPIYDEFTHDGTNPYSTHTVDSRVDPSAKSQPRASHTGRDVALGGASAGAAAYEGNKLHDEHKNFDQPSTVPSQSASIPAAATSKSTTSTPSQPAVSRPADTTSSSRDFQTAPSAATNQPQAPVPSTSQTSQQPKSAGTGYYVAPHGTAVSNEKPTDKHSNLGRDAAIGAGAGVIGIGGYEATKHRDPASQTQPTAPSNIAHTGAAPTGYDDQRVPGATANQPTSSTPSTSHISQQPQPTSSGYYTQPSTQSQAQPSEHHYGRDAAAAAGTGAAGVGGYEALKHHENKAQATPNVPSDYQQSPQTSQTPAGYYGQRAPDATVNQPTSSTPLASQASQQPHTAASGYSGPPNTQSTAQPTQHHYGRDAAAVVGTGAAGLGGYEALKHHENKSQATPNVPADYSQTPQTSQAPHVQAGGVPGQAITTDSRQPAPGSQPQPGAEHHYGRDAAAGVGAGAAGIGGYEALKHREDRSQPSGVVPGSQQPVRAADPTTSQAHPTAPQEQKPSEDHYGRDAAIGAGAVGAGGAAAYEARKHEEQKQALADEEARAKEIQKQEKQHEKELKKEEKQHEKEVKKEEKQHAKEIKKEEKQHEKEVKAAEAEHEKQVKKEAKEHEKEVKAAEAEQERQAKQEAKEHEKLLEEDRKRREKEAAAATAGVGAAGLGAEEYERRKNKDSDDEKEGGKKKGGLLGLFRRDKKDKDTEDENLDPKHHKGEEAAAGVGAVGAAGLGKHELDKHKENEQTPRTGSTTTESDDGKKKGGLLGGLLGRTKKDKDSADETPEEQPREHHYGRDAAIGAGAVGAGALGKHEYDEHKDRQPKATAGNVQAADAYRAPVDTPQQSSHHRGEEAAAGAGVLGAGALGKHEYDSRHQTTQDPRKVQPASTVQPLESQTQRGVPTQSGIAPQSDLARPQHHYKEEAAAGAGVLGAGALGKHEYDSRHQTAQDPRSAQPTSTVQPLEPQTQRGIPTQNEPVGHQHHYKEDAAVGAGVLGAGALGKHEYDSRHQDPRTAQTTSTAQPLGSQTYGDVPAQDDPRRPQHHYKEEAAAGAGLAGTGLLGKHEYDKHRQQAPQDTATTGPASTSQPTQPLTSKDEAKHPHRKEEAAAAAGLVGAGAVGKHEADKHHRTTGDQDLGVSQGQVHEGYRHPKTEADIAAEKRNDIPVLGQFHREGHLHGKEGGAPGAVGVPPEERDQAYIASQKQAHTEHKKPGLLDKILHRHPKEDDTTETSGSEHDGRNRLHKDPPGDHPAANTTIDPVTGLPIDTTKGPHTGAGTDGIPHGHHSENLPDSQDVNVQHPQHDAAHMGYGADTSGRYNV